MHNTCEASMKTNNDDITGKSPHPPVIEHGKRFFRTRVWQPHGGPQAELTISI